MYKHGRGVELGPTEKQLHLVARAGFEPGATELKSSASKPLGHAASLSFLLSYNCALTVMNEQTQKWTKKSFLKKFIRKAISLYLNEIHVTLPASCVRPR